MAVEGGAAVTAAQWAQRLAKRSAAGDWASLTASECRELAALLRRAERVEAAARAHVEEHGRSCLCLACARLRAALASPPVDPAIPTSEKAAGPSTVEGPRVTATPGGR